MKKEIKYISQILLFFCLFISSNSLFAQITLIPDSNFEQALVNQGIDSDGLVNGQMLTSDASSVISLNVRASNISNLTGIEAFTSVAILHCDSNQLTNLNTSNLIALKTLRCQDNQLTTLDLSSNTAIEWVSCYRNQLTSLNFANNSALTWLACYNNQLTSLNLNSSTSLEYLYCNDNQLTSLSIATSAPLKGLECYNNQLSSLSIINSSALERLYCQNNQLTSLNLTNNTVLQYLDCDNNAMTSLSIVPNNTLQYLSCGNNQLTSLNLSNNTNLQNLNCYNNQLTSLSLNNNTNLQALGCQNNQLTSLNLNSNTGLKVLLCGNNQFTSLNLISNTTIERIECEKNQLTSLIIPPNSTLQRIKCDHNLLPSLNLANSTALETLVCNNNLLPSLNLSSNVSLQILVCDSNQLASVDISGCLALENFSCNTNQLTALNLNNNTNLGGLSCADNSLGTLNISNNSSLTSLACQNNLLTTIDISNNILLSSLNCSDNQLSSLNITDNHSLSALVCSNNQLTSLDLANNPLLQYLICDNNLLSSLELIHNPGLQYFLSHNNQLHYLNLKGKPYLGSAAWDSVNVSSNLANMVICVDDATAASSNPKWTKDAMATYVETCPNTTLIGHVRVDMNTNCIADSTESVVQNAILSISDGNNTIYRLSNSSGYYTGELDTGNYSIDIIPPNPYFSACNVPQVVSIDSINDKDTIDWALQNTDYCPFMTATLAAPFLRATGGGSAYTVNYCNSGTAPSYDTYVEVTIDSSLTVLGASLAISSQLGNVYTFDLDTVNVGECGSFTIAVIADSSLQPGQTLCSEVHIYPDSLCNNVWAGPIIQASGMCETDTVRFELKNIGNNMLVPHNYIVIEDNIIMDTDTFTLGSNGILIVDVPTQPGKTYRIEAEQAVNFPPVLGPHIAHANVIGCQPGGSPVWGTALNYYNGNPAPWIDIDCQALIAAYDPNDKTPQPLGYDVQHYITNETPLSYKVRFQNTGNDTAFNVVILDTISTHLDLTTLQMKAASHNYTWELVTGNALKVSFPNIKLVDSLTNEPLSHGFFTYEINPKPNLPLGTRIENTAAIYFDYNPPIFTNTTFHTIGEDFITLVSVDYIHEEHIGVKAYPNPFDQMTTIEVEGEEYETLELIVTDIAGRVVKNQEVYNNNKIQVYRNNLVQGIYIYQLKGDRNLICTGKLIVK